LIAAPGSGYGSSRRRCRASSARPNLAPDLPCGSSAHSFSSGRTRTVDTVSANGGNWISGGAGGVFVASGDDVSLSITAMARHSRSRRGGPVSHEVDPKNHDQGSAGADIAQKAAEHGAAGIGDGGMLFKDSGAAGAPSSSNCGSVPCSSVETRAGPIRRPEMGSCGFWRRHVVSGSSEADFTIQQNVGHLSPKPLYLALGPDLRLFWPTEAITAP
jgi:hypothetical protein